MNSSAEITRENFDAVLFDFDGVLTSSAKLHAAAWKRTFDMFSNYATFPEHPVKEAASTARLTGNFPSYRLTTIVLRHQ